MSGNATKTEKKTVKLKLCLVGESAVGKTSLIRRFVFDDFEDRYIVTLGAKVTKKEVKLKNPKNNAPMDAQLLIWDIVGDQSFRQLLKEAYFFGSQGIIGTCDLTRENTLAELHHWVELVRGVTDKIPIIILGNKNDLEGKQVSLDEIKKFTSSYENTTFYLSSAKTGENVELAFKTISEKILADMYN
jgi:small GTP-binding protein